MPRKSRILTLPPDIKNGLDALIAEGRESIDDLTAYIMEQCEKQNIQAPSRSAVGRYSADVAKTTQALRESREMASAIVQELGPSFAEGEQGRALVQMLRTLVWRVAKPQVDNQDAEIDTKTLMQLTRTIKDLSATMRLEQDFVKNIEARAKAQAQEEMQAEMHKAAQNMQAKEGETPLDLYERMMRVYRGEA